MSWWVQAIKNYVNFSGRARRKEFWMFYLFNIIFSVVASLIDQLIDFWIAPGIGMVSIIYSLFILLPGISIVFRRLHDIDKSGWWWLIGLIPLVGWIILLVFYVKEGTQGENKYGADPKAAA